MNVLFNTIAPIAATAAQIMQEQADVITNSSGVSWGVLVTFSAANFALILLLWKTLTASIEKATDKTIGAVEKLESRVDSVEKTARNDIKDVRGEHLKQRDAVVGLLSLHMLVKEVRKDTERLKLKIASNCPRETHD